MSFDQVLVPSEDNFCKLPNLMENAQAAWFDYSGSSGCENPDMTLFAHIFFLQMNSHEIAVKIEVFPAFHRMASLF